MTKHPDTADDEPRGGRPGPADHGREGGMATRENAPELTKPDRDDQAGATDTKQSTT